MLFTKSVDSIVFFLGLRNGVASVFWNGSNLLMLAGYMKMCRTCYTFSSLHRTAIGYTDSNPMPNEIFGRSSNAKTMQHKLNRFYLAYYIDHIICNNFDNLDYNIFQILLKQNRIIFLRFRLCWNNHTLLCLICLHAQPLRRL